MILCLTILRPRRATGFTGRCIHGSRFWRRFLLRLLVLSHGNSLQPMPSTAADDACQIDRKYVPRFQHPSGFFPHGEGGRCEATDPILKVLLVEDLIRAVNM